MYWCHKANTFRMLSATVLGKLTYGGYTRKLGKLKADRVTRMNDVLARQAIGKVPSRRLAPCKATNLDARCLQLGGVLTEPPQRAPRAAIPSALRAAGCARSAPKHLALHPGDHQSNMRDH